MQPHVAGSPRRPGSFDWVLEARGTRADRLPPRPLPGRKSTIPSPNLAFPSLWRAARQLGQGFENRRILEIAPTEPLLAEALGPARARSHLVLLDGRSAARAAAWSSRFPQIRFYVGALASLAPFAGEAFDWIVAWNPQRPTNETEQDSQPFWLARLLTPGGMLAMRVPLNGSRAAWIRMRGEMEHAQLKPQSREDLPDGSSLVLARRC